MKFSLKAFLLTTFILLEIAALSAFPAISSCHSSGNPRLVSLKGKLVIEFYFGRRRYGCNDSGLCRIHVSIEPTRTSANGIGLLSVDEATRNRLILEIDKGKGITEEQYRKYFNTGTFDMGDDCPLPDDVLKQLGLTSGKVIPAGKYAVTEKGGILYLSLPIQ